MENVKQRKQFKKWRKSHSETCIEETNVGDYHVNNLVEDMSVGHVGNIMQEIYEKDLNENLMFEQYLDLKIEKSDFVIRGGGGGRQKIALCCSNEGKGTKGDYWSWVLKLK